MTTPPEPSEARRQHLGFIQTVISRQAGNSFLVKGWSLTVAALFYGYAANQAAWAVALVGAVAIAAFWWLDAFYLRQERLFRLLYDRARLVDTDVELFSMDTRAFQVEPRTGWQRVIRAPVLVVQYATLMAAGVVIATATSVWS